MRLSVTLDPDLHQLVSARARARRVSLSKEINSLLRAAVSPGATDQTDTAPLITLEGRRQFPVSRGLHPITSEDVARLDDEDDFRHLHP